ncbi:MAG: PAS domain-containing protein [Pseudomonadota bacterium]
MNRQNPEQFLEVALEAIGSQPDWRDTLNRLPVPVYTTDDRGKVTFWNDACVNFAGREPELGRDRWCVTWQLYTTAGDPLRHEDCPMAQALAQRRPVRDAIAIAERPDGSRVAFRPYPTPLFNDDGSLSGAINMLIDVTDEQSDALHEQAERCRRLAGALYTRESSIVLEQMAVRYERTASELETGRR